MQVHVVYARAGVQTLISLRLRTGATAADAVQASGILDLHPEIDWPAAPLGVFGQRIAADTVLRMGDRVEIYRPLTIDPKERRRARAGSGEP